MAKKRYLQDITPYRYGNKFNEPISKAFKRKSWNEQRTNDSWAIFKIMSEFVEGYERLSRIGPCVSIFGSARLKEDDAWYQDAQRIAEGLGKRLRHHQWRWPWHHGGRQPRRHGSRRTLCGPQY